MQDDVRQFSAEDLSLVTDGESDGGDKGTIAGGAPAADAKTATDVKPNGKGAEAAPAGDKPKAGTIASGRDTEKDEANDEADKPYWPDDWREKMARRHSGDDDKAYKKELKRLQRFADPAGVYGTARELEAKFDKGGLIKVPDKDAKPEEVAAFNKALGVPEKPEEYYSNLQLDNGAVVGEADKPFVDSFATHMHKANARPDEFKAAINWYYKQQEINAAELDEADDTHRIQSERDLKTELGASFKREIKALPILFQHAPGGSDINNEKGVYARIMGGRTADGRLMGNDPDVLRWLMGLRAEINPNATVTEDGTATPQDTENRIREIEKIMRENRREYDKHYDKEYRDLLGKREKNQARAR